jgi:hypothetical protein
MCACPPLCGGCQGDGVDLDTWPEFCCRHPERLSSCSARPAIRREHIMHEFEWQKYFMKRIIYTKIDRYEKLEFANGSNLAVDGNVFLHAVGSGKR